MPGIHNMDSINVNYYYFKRKELVAESPDNLVKVKPSCLIVWSHILMMYLVQQIKLCDRPLLIKGFLSFSMNSNRKHLNGDNPLGLLSQKTGCEL